jgi:hypothetical protein
LICWISSLEALADLGRRLASRQVHGWLVLLDFDADAAENDDPTVSLFRLLVGA